MNKTRIWGPFYINLKYYEFTKMGKSENFLL